MTRFYVLLALQTLGSISAVVTSTTSNSSLGARCRTQPGDPSFPTTSQLGEFNSSIEGRLINVVPTAQVCKGLPGGCSDAQWTDVVFRDDIPGSMLQANWEQDYDSIPPSLCFRNTTVCGQGNVPILGINATTAAHIQAGVRFAQTHNLKVAIKASGHDYLGRSTAKNSLLLWTHNFQNITFHDSFRVGGKDKGSAVTVGSGVSLHTLYQATKAQGKIYVGGTADTVVPAGGYVQGAGHSLLSPTFGLAADNTLEFQVVIADGSLVTANEISHPDLFWALRGGGSGSWGVIISATFRTFPTFDVVLHQAFLEVNSSAALGQLAALHAQHIFDWDDLRAGHYFDTYADPPGFNWTMTTAFPNTSLATANATMTPFMNALSAQGFSVNVSATLLNVNDALTVTDDRAGNNFILGSRLFPAGVYRENATAIGEMYQRAYDMNVPAVGILGLNVAGGQVSENANIKSAVNPKWRTAKTQLIIALSWTDDTPPDAVESLRQDLTHNKVPLLDKLAGAGSGAYSNEADAREPDFQTTFFGPNYPRLSAIKEHYDPHALFIVGAGVGSEKWDAAGLCRVDWQLSGPSLVLQTSGSS